MSHEYRHFIPQIAENDARCVVAKDIEYGGSWLKRGGVSVFMMLARKWDRIEELMQRPGPLRWDILRHAYADDRDEGLLDDIRDLRRYLILVESEILHQIEEETKRAHRAVMVGAGNTIAKEMDKHPALRDTGDPEEIGTTEALNDRPVTPAPGSPDPAGEDLEPDHPEVLGKEETATIIESQCTCQYAHTKTAMGAWTCPQHGTTQRAAYMTWLEHPELPHPGEAMNSGSR